MDKTILQLANAYYKEWLKTNDPYEDDFFSELEALAPGINFALAGTDPDEIIII